MAHPGPSKDAWLVIFVGILAAVGLVGTFVLVIIRARLVRSLAELENNLEIQKMSGIDLRRRLEDTNRLLKVERERATDALDRVNHVSEDCHDLTESLKTQIHSLEDHSDDLQHEKDREREEFLQHEHELISEIEECRGDVKDLYEDLKAAHASVQQNAELIEQWRRAYQEEAHSHGQTATELEETIVALQNHEAAARPVVGQHYPASAAEGDLVNTHHPAHHPATHVGQQFPASAMEGDLVNAHHPPSPAQPVPAAPVPPAQPQQQAPPVAQPQPRAQHHRPPGSTLEEDMVRAEAAMRRANAPADPGAHRQPPTAQPVPVQAQAQPQRAQPAAQPAARPVPQPARAVPQPARPAPQPVPQAAPGTRYPVEETFA